MIDMSRRILLASMSIAAAVLLAIVLQTTTPATIHPLGIVLVFVLCYVVILGLLTYLLAGIAAALRRWLPEAQRRAVTLSFRRCYYFGSVLALAPVLLIGARSVGRGGWYELALVFAFEAIACFYVAKR